MNDRARWLGIRALAITFACSVAVLAVYAYVPEFLVTQATVGAVALTLVIGGSIVGKQWHDEKEQKPILEPEIIPPPPPRARYEDERYESPEKPRILIPEANRETQSPKPYDEYIKGSLIEKITEAIENGNITVKITGTIDPEKPIDPQRIKVRFKPSTSKPSETKPLEQKPKEKKEEKPVLRRQA